MKISQYEASVRIAAVLKAAGVKAKIGGCSCCGIFEVEFPDGETCDVDSVWIETDPPEATIG